MRKDIEMDMTEELEVRFTYHPPTGTQKGRMAYIRDECRHLAELVVANTPQSREQALALTALEEVSMWANAAIARREETT